MANSIGTFCLAYYRGNLSEYGAIEFGSYNGADDDSISERFNEIPFWIIMGSIGGLLGKFELQKQESVIRVSSPCALISSAKDLRILNNNMPSAPTCIFSERWLVLQSFWKIEKNPATKRQKVQHEGVKDVADFLHQLNQLDCHVCAAYHELGLPQG